MSAKVKSIYTKSQRAWVDLDGEPDDGASIPEIAVYADIHMLVVGETTNPRNSLDSIAKFAKYLHIKPSLMVGVAGDVEFKYAGFEHEEVGHLASVKSAPEYTRERYISEFRSFVNACHKDGADPIYICLKPPREMIDCYSELTEELGQVSALMYTGHNKITVVKRYSETKFTEMVRCFGNFTIYGRTSMVGGSMSMSNTDPRKEVHSIFMNNKAKSFEQYSKSLSILNKNWNKHMMERGREAICEKLLDPNTFSDIVALHNIAHKSRHPFEDRRSFDAIGYLKQGVVSSDIDELLTKYTDISKASDSQFLLADMCAVAAFFNPAFKQFLFSYGYVYDIKGELVVTDAQYAYQKVYIARPIHFFVDIPREEMMKCLITIMSDNYQ